jgi:3(or 17)beta-hydroxysteroid dehydrogenase
MADRTMKRLTGRVALVTGGASGIGAAAVRQFVAEGAKVVFTDLSTKAGEALARELGGSALFVLGDHTKEQDNRKAVDTVEASYGRLDILYNNAGIILQGNIGDTAADRIEQLLRVNLLGPFLMMRAALLALREQALRRQCAILFTASVQSLTARPGYIAYGASKHGIVHCVADAAVRFGLR